MAAPPENPRMENRNPNAPPGPGASPLLTPRVSVTAALRTAHQLGQLGATVRGNQQAPGPNNNNAGEMPQQTQNLFYMRDRLFLALFFRVTLIYARAFPKTLRRILEFFLLMQSIVLLFLLCYIHIVYTRTPITCLNQYKDSWPRDGILRVEITSDAGDDYDIQKSYEKEEKLRQRAAAAQINHYSDDLLSMMLSADQILLDRVVSTAGGFISSVTNSKTEETKEDGSNVQPTAAVPDPESSTPSATKGVEMRPNVADDNPPHVVSSDGAEIVNDVDVDAMQSGGKEVEPSIQNKSSELDDDTQVAAAEGEDKSSDVDSTSSFSHTASGEGSVSSSVLDTLETDDPANPSKNYFLFYNMPQTDSPYFNKTLEEIEIIKMEEKQREDEKVLKSSVSDLEMFTNAGKAADQAYIVEYALEYGFLRLSPETRQRLNIPVKIVTLDPTKESCFGDSFSVFLLENFLGYDDILMSSIKNLAEAEENKGYLRNVVTGEQFRFVPMWMARTSYIPAMLIMLVFTVSISMLLRYSHHQIFIFIVDLLNNIEGAGSIHIPAAPLFTVILALVGMEAIMSEFFNDTSTAFYVILIVWIADQYDSHSMVYYHHYELPAILRQAQQPEIPTQLLSDDQNQGPPGSQTNPAPLNLQRSQMQGNLQSQTQVHQPPQRNHRSRPFIPHLPHQLQRLKHFTSNENSAFNLRRRVTALPSTSTLNNSYDTSSNELSSINDAIRSTNNSRSISSPNPDFSTRVNVSFSTDSIVSPTARSSNSDVSSILGTSMSGTTSSASPFSPLTRIQ
ncbi:Membralin [Orchesella cincta]|uniref:Membralin n=1 Tax=Orchesella cincta TaxID=48709 RepID=A0A1D2N0S7_ORCCI|nr:Membralin [Orchesella cincta]